MNRRRSLLLALLLAFALPLPAAAHLARGGAVSTFDLHATLAQGPVVLYFFPKSFTSGCTAEAHDFAEHIAAFKRLGATVVGVSGDDIATQGHVANVLAALRKLAAR